MPLFTDEAVALFNHARNSIPRWLTSGKSATLEWLYGMAVTIDGVKGTVDEWLDGIFIESATGRYLDQHAKDRDTSRRVDETDSVLKERIRHVEDALTDPALQAGINAMFGDVFADQGFDVTFTVSDTYSGITKTVTIPEGAYTAREMVDLIQAQLPEGWTFEIINARARFYVQDPDTSTHYTFSITWSDQEAADLLHFDPDPIVDWDVHNVDPLIVVANDGTFDVWDEDSPPEVTVTIPAGSYTRAELESLIVGQLAPMPLMTFEITDYMGGAYATFDGGLEYTVIWGVDAASIELRDLLGFTGDHDPQTSDPYTSFTPITEIFDTGYYQSFWPISPLCAITHLRRDRAHYQLPGATTAFLNRGYRMTYSGRPMTYIVLLPVATEATALAVEEYLRQYGPAGYLAMVLYSV